MSFEGSNEIDEGTLPTQESSEETQEVSNDSQEESNETSENVEGEKPVLTEKGTKLDPNPLSAAHQQLANERRIRQQYEQVLSNPEALKKYAQESGLTLTEAKAEIKEEQKQFTPDQFQTADDVARTLNEMQTNFSKELQALKTENQSLKQGFTGFSERERLTTVANNMSRDITTVQSKYPELNPNNQNYDPELEKELGELFQEIDYDQRSQSFRGNYSIVKLADRIMKASGRARQAGSTKAQTDVKVKQAGKVVTSSKASSKNVSESKDPGTAIAERIARALGNK